MGIIFTKPTPGASGGSGVYSQSEKLALEMEMAFKALNINVYKEFTYYSTSENLITIEYYTDTGKGTQLFTTDLSYNTSSQLTSSKLTRNSDSVTLTKSFIYDGVGNLTSISRS